MKLLIITGSYPPLKCGVGDYTKRLVKELHKVVQLKVITSNSVISDDCVRGIIKSWGIKDLFKILGFICDYQPDIVHIQYPTKGYGRQIMVNLLPIICRTLFPKIPIITTLHEFSISHILRKMSIIPLLLFSNKIVITDEREKKYISLFFPFIKEKMISIPLGVIIDSPVEKAPSSLPNDKDKIILSYFGHLSKSKGIEALLEAFYNLLKKGLDLRLLMICELIPNNKYHQKIKNLIDKSQITEKVIITGYLSQEEVIRYLRLSQICVLPFREGVSLRRTTFLTVLSQGIPVITTIKKEVPSGLINNENVVLVSANNVHELTEGILFLIKNPQKRKEIGEKGKRFAAGFPWKKIVEKHFSLYQAVLK